MSAEMPRLPCGPPEVTFCLWHLRERRKHLQEGGEHPSDELRETSWSHSEAWYKASERFFSCCWNVTAQRGRNSTWNWASCLNRSGAQCSELQAGWREGMLLHQGRCGKYKTDLGGCLARPWTPQPEFIPRLHPGLLCRSLEGSERFLLRGRSLLRRLRRVVLPRFCPYINSTSQDPFDAPQKKLCVLTSGYGKFNTSLLLYLRRRRGIGI